MIFTDRHGLIKGGLNMASSLEYVQYVAAQLSGAGVISYKKLFGEYGLWCGGKFFGTVENNQFYVVSGGGAG